MPQKLCDTCAQTLQLAYTFRVQAIETETELKKLMEISAIKTETFDDATDSQDDFYFPEENVQGETIYRSAVFDTEYNDHKNLLKTAMSKKKYNCLKCAKFFHIKSSLERHELRCGVKNIKYKDNVVKSENIHKFTCTYCTAAYTTKNRLINHIRKHEIKLQDKIYTCDYCNKTFTAKTLLRRHIRLDFFPIQ